MGAKLSFVRAWAGTLARQRMGWGKYRGLECRRAFPLGATGLRASAVSNGVIEYDSGSDTINSESREERGFRRVDSVGLLKRKINVGK